MQFNDIWAAQEYKVGDEAEAVLRIEFRKGLMKPPNVYSSDNDAVHFHGFHATKPDKVGMILSSRVVFTSGISIMMQNSKLGVQ